VTRNARALLRSLTAVAAIAAVLTLVPAALAGKGHGGTNTASTSCAPAAPGVSVDNNYAWGSPGSWGLPGQQLSYFVQVRNYDVGCGSSSFTIALSAPSGFSVSVPANTVTLNSSSSGYLWAYVTSPGVVADGDYPLSVSVERSGTAAAQASTTNYYKVYSSDTSAPTLFWSNPANGQTISGTSYTVNVSSSDDHAVQRIEYYLDGRYVTSTNCDDVSYTCQLSYKWSLNRARGSHTATFRSYDWMGNVGVLTVNFTVSK
jgi:Bacterial Ig domain